MFIREVIPSIIRNSRKEKSIQIEIQTYEGWFKASAPSGKSKGIREVQSYHNKGIQASLKRLQLFAKKYLKEKNFIIKKISDLKQLKKILETFEKKYGFLGGNTHYTLHTVFLKAAAKDNNKELWEFINDDVNKGKKPIMPMPVSNCIGGGAHSKLYKGKKPDFQEFLLIPKEKTFSKAVTKNIKAYSQLKKIIKSYKKNDENAWMTNKNNEETLTTIQKIAQHNKLRIGIDAAASNFYKKGYYHYKNKELIRDHVDQKDYITRITKKYNIFYLEDPIDEKDFSGFKEVLASIKEKKKTNTLIVGDDLTTTHLKDTQRAIRNKCINAMIIKPNQVGSILETAQVVNLCKKNNITMIFSHRSGETMDNALADYAIGFGAQYIKCGINGKERLIKIKRIIDIEKKINKKK